MEQPQAPVMAVETRGNGPDVVLFHGGMGCRKHWIRNIGPLSEHYPVHALDHPAYGESAAVPQDMSGTDYLDLVSDAFVKHVPGEAPLRFAGFSFGGAIAANLAARLGDRVTHLCLISTASLPAKTYAQRPTRSYKSAGDDEALFREIYRHNLLVNMLSHPESVTEETIDIQAYCVPYGMALGVCGDGSHVSLPCCRARDCGPCMMDGKLCRYRALGLSAHSG